MPSFESFGGMDRGKGLKPEEKEKMPLDAGADEDGEHSVESIKDTLFDQYLKQQLIEDFFDHLEEYLDEEAIDAMRGELARYDDADVYATLSLPHELRDRKFAVFQKEVETGKEPAALMKGFIDASKQRGYSIGYHTSPNDIKPREGGQWNITGYEKDHRDDDLSKAYYSTKYRHLFKKKDPKFIYIVRIDPETHRTDGNWSRAGVLSVVARVPFSDVVEYVESTARDMEKEKADA